MRIISTAALAAVILLSAAACPAGDLLPLVPLKRKPALDSIGIGMPGNLKKRAPSNERVGIDREEATDSLVLTRKDPLVALAEPRAGVVSRSFQRVSGMVGGGISKAFLRINDETRIVPVTDGRFSAFGAMRPGLNTITALAWDLDGNLGKNSMKVFFRPDDKGAEVRVIEPEDGAVLDITRNRVITVRAQTSDRSVSEGVLVVNNIPRRVSMTKGVLNQQLALMPGQNEIFVEVEGKDGRTGTSGTVTVQTYDAMPKDLVAVLSWDSDRSDLDMHVWDSFGHHTFAEARDPYSCEAAIPKGMLDIDRKGGFGPEVFTLESAEPEVYAFYANYSQSVGRDPGTDAYLRVLLYGDEPSRRIMRVFGPAKLGYNNPSWEAAHVKMPEGVFFQEKESDLEKTLGMDSRAVKRLALILEEENRSFGLLAIAAMGQTKSEEAVGPLAKALAGGPVEVRRAAAGALWSIRSVESVDVLVDALSDEDAEVRRAAAGALGDIGEPKAVYALTGLLSEEGDILVRLEAIRALGKIGDPRALDTLMPQSRDADPRLRIETIRAMGGIKDPRAGLVLALGLKDESVCVREVAARALGRLGSEDSVRDLMDLLYFDEDEGVRVQAAIALGNIASESSTGELERAAEKDYSQKVRFCARKALEDMAAPAEAKPKPIWYDKPLPDEDDLVIY